MTTPPTPDANELHRLLTEAERKLRKLAKTCLAIKTSLDKPYSDTPQTTPWRQFVEQPTRDAYNLAQEIRQALRAHRQTQPDLMHSPTCPRPHAPREMLVTSDDLAARTLAAIERLEAAAVAVRDAPPDVSVISLPGRPVAVPSEAEQRQMRDRLRREQRERLRAVSPERALLEEQGDPEVVLRRCAAARELVDLHGIVWRDVGWLAVEDGEIAEEEAELPVCGLCVPRHSSFERRENVPEGPCATLRLVAAAFGIEDGQETTS
jgi:small-conductance mechanosensitive channel